LILLTNRRVQAPAAGSC